MRTTEHVGILSRSKVSGEPERVESVTLCQGRVGKAACERRTKRWGMAIEKASEDETQMLTAIKLLHTVVWALLAAAIVSLPFLAGQHAFRWATILSVVILVEGVVLLANGWRCPMTDLAAKYTVDRSPSFDIYMPNWLARHNKTIFTALFLVNESILLVEWLRNR
jgi:hypothetical protein